MFNISSDHDVPNLDYAEKRVKETMAKGIYVRDIQDKNIKFTKERERLEGLMGSNYGIDNPRSHKQLAQYLEMQDDPVIKEACYDEKNNKWITNKSAMESLALSQYEFAIDLLRFRQAATYESAVKQILNWSDSNRVLHPAVSKGITNRFNYSNPGLMNIPKKLLWEIISPRKEGNVLFSVDIKNQEPWIMINMLGIESLKEKLNSGNKNGLYNTVAFDILGREPDEKERTEIKRAWLAMTYGASKVGIVGMCKHTDGEVIYKYFNSFKEFKAYKSDCIKSAKMHLQTVETYFNTEVTTDEAGRGLWRVLMDLPVQGTGADILALLIKHFDDETKSRGLSSIMEFYFSRHDEVIIEVDRGFYETEGLDKVTSILRDIFEHSIDDWEPFTVEIKVLNGFELDGNVTEDDED